MALLTRLRRTQTDEAPATASASGNDQSTRGEMRRNARRTLHYARPYWTLVVCSGALVFLGAAASLLQPWPLKILVDNVLGDSPLPRFLDAWLGPIADDRHSLLVFAVVGGLLVTVLFNGLGIAENYVNTKLDQSMVLDFRSDLFRHAQRLSMAYHDQKRTGKLMYLINSSPGALGNIFATIPALLQSLITLLGMFWVAMRIEVHLALLSMIVAPLLTYAIRYYTQKIEPRIYEVRDMEHESLSIAHEAMAMLRVIISFGREDHEYQRFRRQGEGAVAARVKLTVRQTLFSLACNTTTAAGNALVLGVGALYVMRGELTVGSLLVIVSYVQSMYQPLESISATAGNLQEQFIRLRASLDLLDTQPDVTDPPEAIGLDRAEGAVRFDGVHFNYRGRPPVLKNISFEARAGELICIVGPTGAGKSTLASLIPRFYDPRRGKILLDGIDTRQLELASLRRQISIVLQEPLLFATTIADNIRYGRLDATDEEIVEAAKAANAHDFISRLPNGYETKVGERGAQLSGGERQRIAVARAFLKDAPILILDEPTSSIDSKTEAVILDALDRLMEGKTTFMIAHRLSTIRHADKILVINHGELVEAGTHDELLLRDGLYRQLWEMQMAAPRGKREPVLIGANGA
jgi:ATP-binding cassette subfamily B protein